VRFKLEADICGATAHIRKGPEADIRTIEERSIRLAALLALESTQFGI